MLSKGIKLGIIGAASLAVVIGACALFTTQKAEVIKGRASDAYNPYSVSFALADGKSNWETSGNNPATMITTSSLQASGIAIYCFNKYETTISDSDSTGSFAVLNSTYETKFTTNKSGSERTYFRGTISSVEVSVYSSNTLQSKTVKMQYFYGDDTENLLTKEKTLTLNNSVNYTGTFTFTEENVHYFGLFSNSAYSTVMLKGITINYTC